MNTSSTFIILQARTGSTRLPGKMVKPFYHQSCVLDIILQRIKHEFGDDFNNIIVATTTNPKDDEIVKVASDNDITGYRGSENDVLARFIDAAESVGASKIIRVCADNVFLDTRELHNLYDVLDANTEYDYISFQKSDGTPSIKTHYGFWAEGVSLRALKQVAKDTDELLYHEHVTNYIYTHPDEYSCHFLRINPLIESRKNLRLTLDTITDFEIQQKIYSDFQTDNIEITPTNLINYIDSRPTIYDSMRTVIEQNSK